MVEALAIDAESTIKLLTSIGNLYPALARNHVCLDNARYLKAIAKQSSGPRQIGAGMAGATGLPDRPALPAALSPPPQSDQTIVGSHAPACHQQQMPRHMRPVRRRDTRIPARDCPAQLDEIP